MRPSAENTERLNVHPTTEICTGRGAGPWCASPPQREANTPGLTCGIDVAKPALATPWRPSFNQLYGGRPMDGSPGAPSIAPEYPVLVSWGPIYTGQHTRVVRHKGLQNCTQK